MSIKLRDSATIAAAARHVGKPTSTIWRAVQRGEIKTLKDAVGDDHVLLGDVCSWITGERKPGRKPTGRRTILVASAETEND